MHSIVRLSALLQLTFIFIAFFGNARAQDAINECTPVLNNPRIRENFERDYFSKTEIIKYLDSEKKTEQSDNLVFGMLTGDGKFDASSSNNHSNAEKLKAFMHIDSFQRDHTHFVYEIFDTNGYLDCLKSRDNVRGITLRRLGDYQEDGKEGKASQFEVFFNGDQGVEYEIVVPTVNGNIEAVDDSRLLKGDIKASGHWESLGFIKIRRLKNVTTSITIIAHDKLTGGYQSTYNYDIPATMRFPYLTENPVETGVKDMKNIPAATNEADGEPATTVNMQPNEIGYLVETDCKAVPDGIACAAKCNNPSYQVGDQISNSLHLTNLNGKGECSATGQISYAKHTYTFHPAAPYDWDAGKNFEAVSDITVHTGVQKHRTDSIIK